MTPSQLMQALADAGAPMEAIVIALRALEDALADKDAQIAARDAAVSEKRAKDAERKRLERASKDSPRTQRGQSKRPPIEELHTPEQSSPDGEACLPKRKSTPLHFLPDGWEPTLTPAAQKLVDSWPPGMFDRQLSAFRNHAADKGRKSRDWQAAFRTWLDNADKWKPANGRSNGNTDTFASLRGSRPVGALDMVLDAERELQAEAFRENPGADWPPRAALPSH